MPFFIIPALILAIFTLLLSVGLGLLLNLVIGGIFLIFLVLFPFGILYFLPSFIAWGNNHSYKEAILILNVFTGWTFFGWVASLIWAFLDDEVDGSVSQRLDSLEKLKAAGKISEEEYAKLRGRVLGL